MGLIKLFLCLFLSVLIFVSPIVADPVSAGLFDMTDFSEPNAALFDSVPDSGQLAGISPRDVLPRSIEFVNDRLTLEVSHSADLSALLGFSPDGVSAMNAAYFSSDASVVTVARGGVATARGRGSADVTAVSVNGHTATVHISVYCVDVESFSFPVSAVTGFVGDSVRLVYDIEPSDASLQAVSYSSSDPDIAYISSDGTVHCNSEGSATVTGTTAGGLSASCTVISKARPAESVSISAADSASRKGERFRLRAKVLPDNATYKRVIWESSDASVARVNDMGEVTLTGIGSATVTASTSDGVTASYGVSCTESFKSVHYYQGDKEWRFKRAVRKKACLISAFAILLTNAGIEATPRTVYNVFGSTSLSVPGMMRNFAFMPQCAVDENADYFDGFENGRTYIKEPENNAVEAIKYALDRNPEGVLCYFDRGSRSHTLIAIGYIDDEIYFADPGRAYKNGFDVPFTQTWVYAKHKMSYANLAYLVTIDNPLQ